MSRCNQLGYLDMDNTVPLCRDLVHRVVSCGTILCICVCVCVAVHIEVNKASVGLSGV